MLEFRMDNPGRVVERGINDEPHSTNNGVE